METNKDYPCIVCSFRPIIVVGRFLGFSPVAVKCATATSPCNFAPSWLWIFVSFSVVCLISGTMIADINMPQNLNLGIAVSNSAIGTVITTIECLNHLTSIVLLVLNTLQSRTMANAMNSIAMFLKDPGEHSKRSITEKDEHALYSVANRQILSLVFVLLLQNSVVGYFLNKHWATIPNTEFIVLKAVVASISTAVFLTNGFQFGVVTKLLGLMILNVKNQLQTLIEQAVARTDHHWDVRRPVMYQVVKSAAAAGSQVGPEKKVVKICDAIAEVRRVYGKVVKCQHQFNHSVNPQLAIVTTLIMVSVVLSCYLIFQYMITNNEEILFLLTTGRLFMNIFTALYMIHLADTLFKMVLRLKIRSQTILNTPSYSCRRSSCTTTWSRCPPLCCTTTS